MAKKWIKRYLPNQSKVKDNKHLKIFGKFLHDPNLWHINRHSVATGMSIALFAGYMPFPGHMLLATLLAILFRANLLISVALVWISNPFTMGPMFYFSYEVGAHLLGIPSQHFHFEVSFQWFFQELGHIALPLLAGSLLCGLVLAVIGNIVTRFGWRCAVSRAWNKRAHKIKTLKENFT